MVIVEFSDSGEPLEVRAENSRFRVEDGVAYVTSTIEGDIELLPLADVRAVEALPFVDEVECDEFYSE